MNASNNESLKEGVVYFVYTVFLLIGQNSNIEVPDRRARFEDWSGAKKVGRPGLEWGRVAARKGAKAIFSRGKITQPSSSLSSFPSPDGKLVGRNKNRAVIVMESGEDCLDSGWTDGTENIAFNILDRLLLCHKSIVTTKGPFI